MEFSMRRVIRILAVPVLIVLVIYQHWAIQSINQQAEKVTNQMESEYQERMGEIQKLITEKTDIRQQLSQAETELTAIETILQQAQSQLSVLGEVERPLMERITALVESRRTLEMRLASLVAEKESLERKFQDVAILKQTIKELKRKKRGEIESLLIQRDRLLLVVGNRGYLVRDGKSTLARGGTVEVIPAPLPSLARDGEI